MVILQELSLSHVTEFYEEDIGWTLCGMLSSALSKDFRHNH